MEKIKQQSIKTYCSCNSDIPYIAAPLFSKEAFM